MYLPALPVLGVEFGASPGHVQLSVATFFLGLAIGQGFYGPLSDRFGRRVFMITGGLAGGALAGFYLLAVQSKNLALVILLVVLVQGILFQMWNATFATFYQEHFPMRIRVTGFAVAQNIGLMVASFFPSIFTAIAPPGSTNVPLVIGLVITTVERLFRFFAPMLESFAPGLIGGLYRVLPGYHLANLGEWLTEGHVLVVPFPSGAFSMAPGTSLAIVAAWTIGLILLTFRLFRRQDIN